MSRATAAPSATSGAPVVTRTGAGPEAAPAPAASRSRSALNGALEGTPGRMRVLAFVAAVVAAAFGLVGAMSLWSSAGALERADHNTAQVVRIQGTNRTKASLLGQAASRTPPSERTTTRVSTGSPRASPMRPTRSRRTARPSAP